MNVIEYLVSKGFTITSDPTKYASGIWGLRNYTVNGYNYDSYSGGYHRAYDFGSKLGDGAAIPSVCDGVVVRGTTAYGNFGAQVVILDSAGKYQHIYGHLKRNIPVKVGQKVKKGQTIGYQGNTNYNNVYMASHLHYQVQTAGYRAERAFVTDGINPLNISYDGKSTVKQNAKPKKKVVKQNTKNKNRGRSLSAYFKGTVDNLGADVRKRTGNRSKGFKFNTRSGYSLAPGAVVYIFEVYNGWGRIYTGNAKGHGSNDWIWLGRVKITQNFK